MIHLFFPSLWTERRTSGPYLTKEEKTLFYEKGLRPAIELLMPLSVDEWPATFQDELFRAKKTFGGGIAYQTKMIPAETVPLLVNQIREELTNNGIEWGGDIFVLHTIRGTKQASKHSKSGEAATIALAEYLRRSNISQASIENDGEWWIDVGLEFSSNLGFCLQWMTTSHFHVVKNVLQITDAHASRITTLGSSKYNRDIVGHLPAISGCRIEPGVQAEGPYKAAYCQLYVSEKALTYNPERGHHGKAITMADAMGRTQPPAFITGLYELFLSGRQSSSSNARVELRVPFQHATSVLLWIDPDVIKRSLCAFKRKQWWYVISANEFCLNTHITRELRTFRAIRLFALGVILGRQSTGQPGLRVRNEALLLTAACVWLINALSARPDDGPSSRNLMDAVLPLTDASDPDHLSLIFPASRRGDGLEDEDDEDGDEPTIPYNPYGVIFLRTIVLLQVPRMRAGGPGLSSAAFKFIFSKTEDEIIHQYFRIGIISRDTLQHNPVRSNKCRQTATYIPEPGAVQPVLFNLAQLDLSLPPPAVDGGSDLEDSEESADEGMGIDETITQLFRQFLIDMILKVPNSKGNSLSYSILADNARLSVTEDFYKNLRLSEVWRTCQYKVGTKSDFKLAFSHLFPPRGHKTKPKVQNYLQSQYYMKWKDICATADAATVDKIRSEIWKRVCRFNWLPHANQDKIWPTKHIKNFKHYPSNCSPIAPAPRILVRRTPDL
jgi:hypothetical protein